MIERTKDSPEWAAEEGIYTLRHDAITEIHPVAKIFPLYSHEESESIADDMAKHGQAEPVVCDQLGRLIDGRNRLLALRGDEANVIVRVVHFNCERDIRRFAFSKNLHRRHLSVSQRAMLAAQSVEMDRAEFSAAGARPDYDLAGAAAEDAGVSRPSVMRAATILTADPDVAAEVASGEKSLSEGIESVSSIKRYLKPPEAAEVEAEAGEASSAETRQKKTSAKAEESKGAILDAREVRVPDRIVNGWKMAHSEMREHVATLRREIKRLEVLAEGKLIANAMAINDLKHAIHAARSVSPAVVCDRCGGAGCAYCHQAGWLSGETWHQIQAQNDARRGER